MENLHNPTLRVVKILNLLTKESELTLTEISERLDLSKSTIQPILKTLVSTNLLKQNDILKTYSIGITSLKIGQKFLEDNSAIDMIKREMKNIVEECNEICQLGILDMDDKRRVFYIAKEEPKQAIKLISNIGTSLPAHATALGKCLLSDYSCYDLHKLYRNIKHLESFTSKTILDVNSFCEELINVRKNGYSREIEESTKGIECVAVPLVQNSNIVASISVSLPTYRSSEKKIKQIIQLLLFYKNKIDTILNDFPLYL